MRQMFRSSLLAAVLAVFSGSLSGAASVAAQETSFRLNPGDLVRISVWREEQLERQSLVQPDASVSFPLAGSVPAAGLTPAEVQQEITDRLERFILFRAIETGRDLGTAISERWQPMAAAWDAHADGRLYPFNDWHAAMAWLGAGRAGDVQRILDTYRGIDTAASEVDRWTRTTGRR
jgi:hypothetical protein